MRTHVKSIGKGSALVKTFQNTPWTAGGPGGRDQTLAIKSWKTLENQLFGPSALRAPPEVALQCVAGHCY